MRHSYESFQIDTNQIFVDFYFSEMNPRIESLGIRQCGFVMIPDSRILIFKDSFHGVVLKIREDLLDSWKQVETYPNLTEP